MKTIVVITKFGKAIRFKPSEIPIQKRKGVGVRVINLKPKSLSQSGDEVKVGFWCPDDNEVEEELSKPTYKGIAGQ